MADPVPAPAPAPATPAVAAPPPAEAPTATSVVMEDALSAAEGTRKTAQWMASALAGIPSIGIVAAIVSGPGANGFDTTELAWGIALAAFGVALGIYVFARVITPLSLEDFSLEEFPMARVPDSPCDTYAELETVISTFHRTLATAGAKLADAKRAAAKVVAEAAVAQSALTIALERAKETTGSQADKDERAQQVIDASAHAQEKRGAAETAEGEFKSLLVTYEHSQGQLAAAETLRQNVYRLKTADEVRSRFNTARYCFWVVIACVAAGLVLVGIAPKEAPPAATAPTLVTLELSKVGQDKICKVETLQALQVGGDEKAPVVITFPTPECPSQTVNFTTIEPEPLGKAIPAEPVK